MSGTVELLGTLYLLQAVYAVTFVVMSWCFSLGAITKVAIYVSSRPIFAYVINFAYDSADSTRQQKLYVCVALILFGCLAAFFNKKREQLHKVSEDRRKREEFARQQYRSL